MPAPERVLVPRSALAMLRLGLELQSGAGGFDELSGVATSAEQSGWSALWISAPAIEDHSADGVRWDPITLAGALAARTSAIELCMLVDLGGNRHPSILARDVTAVDVVSSGRALLCFSGRKGGAEELREALAICRLLFTEDAPSFEGRHFQVAGAVNRPGPCRPWGVPLALDVRAPESVRPSPGSPTLQALVRMPTALSTSVDVWVTDLAVGSLPRLRDDISRACDFARSPMPFIVWSGEIVENPRQASDLVGQLVAAGADGLKLCLPAGRATGPDARPGDSRLPDRDMIFELGEALAPMLVVPAGAESTREERN